MEHALQTLRDTLATFLGQLAVAQYRLPTLWLHAAAADERVRDVDPVESFVACIDGILATEDDTPLRGNSNGEWSRDDIAPRWGDQTEEEHFKWRKFAFQVRYPGDTPQQHGMNDQYKYDEDD